MTKINPESPTKRETAALHRGKRPYQVTLFPFYMQISVKGLRKQTYNVSYESIFVMGAMKEADRVRSEKKAAKAAGKKDNV